MSCTDTAQTTMYDPKSICNFGFVSLVNGHHDCLPFNIPRCSSAVRLDDPVIIIFWVLLKIVSSHVSKKCKQNIELAK